MTEITKSETETAERVRANRDWLDRTVGELKHHLRMTDNVMERTGLRPVALDRPELRRRLKAVLEGIGDD